MLPDYWGARLIRGHVVLDAISAGPIICEVNIRPGPQITGSHQMINSALESRFFGPEDLQHIESLSRLQGVDFLVNHVVRFLTLSW